MSVFMHSAATIAAIAGVVHHAPAELTGFVDAASWQSAVGSFTTIGFDDFTESTLVTEQYASLGVHFIGGNDVAFFGPNIFPNDRWGLKGHIVPPGDIHIIFDNPQLWLATDYPGEVRYDLYFHGEHIAQSDTLGGAGGAGNFWGIVSTRFFDEVIISDPADAVVAIDDLHFGVPGPGALGLLALAAVMRRRRRG